MVVLIYGMSIYNAPNAGSTLLDGKWYSFGIDCSEEYENLQKEKENADAKYNNLIRHETVDNSTLGSPFSSDLSVSLIEYEPDFVLL